MDKIYGFIAGESVSLTTRIMFETGHINAYNVDRQADNLALIIILTGCKSYYKAEGEL